MKSERIRWNDWDAVCCSAGDCEMVVGVSAGPRILSLRRGASANLLYHDTTDFRVGDWRLYGGHRFTIAPESEETYAPDNQPCAVEMRGLDLCVTAPPGANGTRRTLVIDAAPDGAGFDVRHILENRGGRPWRGALWGITCVPHAGRVVAPCAQSHFRFWPGTANEHWQLGPGYLAMTPNGTRGKAGWHSEAGWVASLQRDAIFVIHNPEAPPLAECVDDGCNFEVFTCAHYVEIETLSGEVTLASGEQASHLQRWRLLPPTVGSQDWFSIGAQTGCIPNSTMVPHAA